jgi:hypothetical protein
MRCVGCRWGNGRRRGLEIQTGMSRLDMYLHQWGIHSVMGWRKVRAFI